ncbi:hypothetical protein BDV98DRAFT_573847 [Pterulicium gracile]|uniref:Uncharacterized protein n=1 Tax=Pterulicium gracile TaxID=1884261 RepID=A0A5C3QBL6_9AGAR|nr:hypothetical protein BDV98DRAFT_573847 [Pterula gracilis]
MSAPDLQVLQLEADNEEKILCDFIITNATHWRSVHSLGIIFFKDDTKEQACRAISLLVRPASSTGDPPNDLFPLLSHLSIRRMVLPLAPVIDMLESRRPNPNPHSDVVQLTSCALIGLYYAALFRPCDPPQHALHTPQFSVLNAGMIRGTPRRRYGRKVAIWVRHSLEKSTCSVQKSVGKGHGAEG